MHAELTTRRVSTDVRNARRGWTERESVLLTLSDGAHRGFGEAAPLPGFSTETTDEARHALVSFRWPRTPPADPEAVEACTRAIGPPSARFAAETALLSLATATRGVPMWRWLGEARDSVSLAVALWDPATWLEDARRAPDAAAYKVKVGREPIEEEARRLRALREQIGDAELRLDANRAVAAEALEARLREWARVAPAFVEEPAQLEVLENRADRSVPLGLDESLAEDPDRALALDGVRALVLKPSRLGLFGALRLAARAPSKRRVVSHLLEGSVARAAAAHLALVTSDDPAGLGPHPALDALSDGRSVPWIDATRIVRPTRPGLGMTP